MKRAVLSLEGAKVEPFEIPMIRSAVAGIMKHHIFHNHLAGGSLNYSYPLVQYKMDIDRTPLIVGVGDGADAVMDAFLRIKSGLSLKNGNVIQFSKSVSCHDTATPQTMRRYKFIHRYVPFNERTYAKYMSLGCPKDKASELNRIITGNILSMYKGLGITINERIVVESDLRESRLATIKEQAELQCFKGVFTTNIFIPDYAGIGNMVSRGFGTVVAV